MTNCIDTDGSSWGVCNEESEREDPREKSKYEYKERCRRAGLSPGFLALWWKLPRSTPVPSSLGYLPRAENQIKVRHHHSNAGDSPAVENK